MVNLVFVSNFKIQKCKTHYTSTVCHYIFLGQFTTSYTCTFIHLTDISNPETNLAFSILTHHHLSHSLLYLWSGHSQVLSSCYRGNHIVLWLDSNSTSWPWNHCLLWGGNKFKGTHQPWAFHSVLVLVISCNGVFMFMFGSIIISLYIF